MADDNSKATSGYLNVTPRTEAEAQELAARRQNAGNALFCMEGELTDLRGARAALSKLAEGCNDDSELQDALFFLAGMIGGTVHELQRLWELAIELKRGGTAS